MQSSTRPGFNSLGLTWNGGRDVELLICGPFRFCALEIRTLPTHGNARGALPSGQKPIAVRAARRAGARCTPASDSRQCGSAGTRTGTAATSSSLASPSPCRPPAIGPVAVERPVSGRLQPASERLPGRPLYRSPVSVR
jgi:hypothetical protein